MSTLKCNRCKWAGMEDERVWVPRKKEPWTNDACCPRCKAKTLIIVQSKS